MGMDVSGKAATTEAGKYFRNNVWWWRPLAGYCCLVAPDITARCTYWQSNDGDGLNAADSAALAAILRERIADGHAKAYEDIRAAEQQAMPDKKCDICAGTGRRAEPPNVGPGKLPCNGCGSTGRRRPDDCSYPFTVANVAEFAEFLEGCGGFAIY